MRLAVSAVALAALAGCSTGTLVRGGTAGSGTGWIAGDGGPGGIAAGGPGGSAGGGPAGAGGIVGVGTGGASGAPAACAGDGGPCPACSDLSLDRSLIEFCVFENQPPDASSRQADVFDNFKGAATIASVEEVQGGNCEDEFDSSTATTEKMVLPLPGRLPLTVFLRIPDLPAGQFMPGDAVDVDVTTSETLFQGRTQRIVLARAGKILAFAALTRYAPADFSDYGMTFQEEVATCVPASCSFTPYSEQVSMGASEAVLSPGQTAQVGTMSISLGRSDIWNSGSNGSCDASNFFQVGGFDTAAGTSAVDGSAP